MSQEELKTRIDPYLKRIDADGEDIGIPPGVTCFGRGPFLKCKDKKVSRNHGLLELASDGQIYITTIHSSLYVRPAGKSEVKHLAKDEKQLLLNGDEFRLLPETFCYKLCVPKTPGTAENKYPPTTVGDTKPEITSPNEGGRGLTEDDQPSDSLQGISQTKNTASTSGVSKEKAGPAPETVLAEESRVDVTSDKTTTDTRADNFTAKDNPLSTRLAPEPPEASVLLLSHGAQADELTRPSHSARNQGEGASKVAASPKAPDHAAGALSNGVAKMPVINGSTRKRKLPAFLLDLDVDSAVCAAGPSADAPKKRGRPRTGGARGGSSAGGEQQRTSPGTSGTPRGRGRGRQRPSERQQLSQQSDDELSPPTPPSAPPQSTDTAAETAASPEDPSVTKSPPSKPSPPQESSPTIDVGSPSDEQVTAAASAATGPAPSSSSPPARKVAAQDKPPRGHAVSDDSGDEDDPAAASSSQRECCAYGANCFRTNPVHRRDFSHPGDADYQAPPPPPPAGQPLPECEFGVNCYRRNPLHRQQFAHTSRPNPRREAKRKARQKAKKAAAAGDTPDSYDLDDSFINDSESDDYAPDDSGSDWSADEGSGSDDDDRRRRDREARRLTGGR
ncbi:aprataxin and PNK-like factor [Amphibalanus amphitrite]|uniref:aprataxin and PNK-like factor n=1 Tax=Amphibalanus amphitrite TaxID=1232801 RepID=UPI001C8FE2F5|nr:aprataxin and PNK-like factor [Amphibalanus amphitrite]